MALSFEDSVRELIKQRLNPSTEEVMRKKAEAEAKYFGDPNVITNEVAPDVWDPNKRMEMADNRKQMYMSSVNSMGDILDNRGTRIDDVVGAFARARAEETAAEKEAWSRNMDTQNLALRRAEVSASTRAAAKADQTIGDLINQLTDAGYDPQTARVMASQMVTGTDDTYDTWKERLYPTPPSTTPAKAGEGILPAIGHFTGKTVRNIPGAVKSTGYAFWRGLMGE